MSAFNAMRVIGAASEDRSLTHLRDATNSDAEIETWAAMRLDQRSRLQLLLFEKEYKFCPQFGCESEYYFMIKPGVGLL